jgi:hypothetical protein
MQSLRGKSHSELNVWILTYEHALRRKLDASYVTSLKLDYRILRQKCERGDDPVMLVQDGYVPIMSQKSQAVAQAEHRRVLAGLETMKIERITRSWVRACCLVSAGLALLFGYFAYTNWENIQQNRNAEQAHAQWRHDIGLDR